MPIGRLNRRRFLSCSAAAGWAITTGREVESTVAIPPIKLGVVGLGTRGTALLRGLLEWQEAEVIGVADPEERFRNRAMGIVEKARGRRPVGFESAEALLNDDQIEAVVVAVPNDLHRPLNLQVLEAGCHLYAEKPLGILLADCNSVIKRAEQLPDRVIHVGLQRRSNPRYQEGVRSIHRGEIGRPLSARASWTSSNGPVDGHNGWLGQRARSGDWMVEQGVHVWDWLNWIQGEVPIRAFGIGHSNLFVDQRPRRDVTDYYQVTLEWANGFQASFQHSWIDPAAEGFTGIRQQIIGTAGGLDFSNGSFTPRDRSTPRRSIQPGNQPDTALALGAFLGAIRSEEPLDPPVSLHEARNATKTALLVRLAVDERRLAMIEEVDTSETQAS